MNIQLFSDLHLEFLDYAAPQSAKADVVVLAGDIHTKARGIAWAAKTFSCPVIYVPGNHEYYSGSLGHTLDKMKAAAQGTHVHLLHDEEVVIDGVRFLGGTLWTDFRLTGNEPLAQWDAQQRLNDYKRIRTASFQKALPKNFLAAHARTRNFLWEKLETAHSGRTVVVTHHAPSGESIPQHYRGDSLSAAYASSLEAMMGADKVALWVHGHIHDSLDYDVHGTRVVCNPRGYAPGHLNPDFNPELVLEV